MPQLEAADLILLLISVVFIAWEVQAIFKTRGKIMLRGKIYGRAISMGIIVVLGCAAVWRRWSEIGRIWPVLLMLVVGTVLYISMQAGFGETGMYFNGRHFAYGKIVYYNIERETERGFSLRINVGRKDYVLEFGADKTELVMAYLSKGKVPDMQQAKAMGRR